MLTFYLDRVETHCLFGKTHIFCLQNKYSICVGFEHGMSPNAHEILHVSWCCPIHHVTISQTNKQLGHLLSFFSTTDSIETETRNKKILKSLFLPIDVVAGTGSLDTAHIEDSTWNGREKKVRTQKNGKENVHTHWQAAVVNSCKKRKRKGKQNKIKKSLNYISGNCWKLTETYTFYKHWGLFQRNWTEAGGSYESRKLCHPLARRTQWTIQKIRE